MVVAIHLHNQQSNNFCEEQQQNTPLGLLGLFEAELYLSPLLSCKLYFVYFYIYLLTQHGMSYILDESGFTLTFIKTIQEVHQFYTSPPYPPPPLASSPSAPHPSALQPFKFGHGFPHDRYPFCCVQSSCPLSFYASIPDSAS